MGVFLGYIAITFLCYGSTLNGGFLVDDWWWAATAKAGGFPLFGDQRIFFRPLSSGLFVGFWHMFGASTLGYHVVTLSFFVLTAWVIRQIWRTVTNNKQPWAATLAGALFLLWPSHSEAVGWIAAFSDLLIVLLGALSLWTYLLYLRRARARFAVATVCLLILALLTKEPAVTLPLIVFLLGQTLTPGIRARKKQTYIAFGCMAGLTLAYILGRQAFLGGAVGGYNGYRLSDVMAALRGWKLTVNLCNLYFPVGKFVAINQTPFMAEILCHIFIFATGAALLRTYPRTTGVSPNQKRLVALILFAGVMWALELTEPALIGIWDFLSQNRAFLILSPVLLGLFGYLVVKVGKRWWTDLIPFLTERKLSLYWIPASIVIFLIDLHFSVVKNLDLWIKIAAFGVYFYSIFITRPQSSQADSPRENAILRRLAFAMFFVSLIALLPGIALPISIDGEQGRFSYLATLFSVISLAAAYAVILKAMDVRRITAGIVAAILFFAAQHNASEWGLAGSVSRQTMALVKSLLPARRIYVVAAPDTIGAALLFRGGIEQIPFVAVGDKTTKMELDLEFINLLPSDQVECRLFSPTVAGVHVTASGESRLERLRFTYDNKDKVFDNPNDYTLTFADFKPTDHAIYIDANGPHLLE
ncbi:MAG TPA: hypothetical protein VGL56_13280 [Fimbriimonadaceae bacterium]